MQYRDHWLRKRLTVLKKKPNELARALDIAPARLYEIMRGVRYVMPSEIEPMASFLKLSRAQLLAAIKGSDIDTIEQLQLDWGTPWQDVNGSAIPLRSAALDGGYWAISATASIALLQFGPRAFCVRVLDENNAPAYHIGDVILIDPERPVGIGQDVLLCNETRALLCTYLGRHGARHKVKQQADRIARFLDAKEWPDSWRVVSRYMGR